MPQLVMAQDYIDASPEAKIFCGICHNEIKEGSLVEFTNFAHYQANHFACNDQEREALVDEKIRHETNQPS